MSLRVEWGRDARQRPVPMVVYASREGAAGAPPPKPTPAPAPKKPAARPATPPPTSTGFRCECGAYLKVGPEHAGFGIACPDCGAERSVERARDPQTQTTVLRTKVTKRGGKGTASLNTETIPCVCGRNLIVRHDDVGKQAECHGCGRLMKLEKTKDPQTLQIGIRAVKLGGESSQELICACGASMLVYPDDLGRQVQCTACGRQMKVKQVRDPDTQASALQVRVVGTDEAQQDLHTEDWSLDDFK